MRFEGLEAFLRATVAISCPPNCLIKRLVKFGKNEFSTSKGGLSPEPWPARAQMTKMTQKIKFFAKSGKVVSRANEGR